MKKQITVKCSGSICEEAMKRYYDILANIIIDEYGIEFAKAVLNELEKDDKC